MTAGIMLLSNAYEHGHRRNVVFGIYGACAPLGYLCGITISGLASQVLGWRWFFWIGALLISASCLLAWFALQSDPTKVSAGSPNITMDWFGAISMFSALMIATFVVVDSAHAPHGWKTVYIYTGAIAAVLLLALTCWIEGWVARDPLLPATVFQSKHLMLHLVAISFSYGSYGIWILYTVFYIQNVKEVSPMQSISWFTPFGIGGLALGLATGVLLRDIPHICLIVVSGIGATLSPLLLAVAPERADYWQFVFPSMLCATVGIDITYNIANIYITNSLPANQQGSAGALCNKVLFISISIATGVADCIASSTSHGNLLEGYRNAFWLAFALSIAGSLLNIASVFYKDGQGALVSIETNSVVSTDTESEDLNLKMP